ncbi:MAG: M15 family metallopeptidase [Deltaproteobacteria bacterium]|nr:M15 family metallopeptidase [Deltaproteobacteria bacterium]
MAKSEKLFFIKTMKEKTKLLPVLEERDLVIIVDNRREFSLHPLAAREWKRMKEKAKGEGVDLQIVSAFRSIARQAEIIEEKRKKGIQEAEIFRVSAPPGFSEHHSGRAIDINTEGYEPLEEDFENSKAFMWLLKHAARFGFRLSYPRKNKYYIAYEPWHWFHERSVQSGT